MVLLREANAAQHKPEMEASESTSFDHLREEIAQITGAIGEWNVMDHNVGDWRFFHFVFRRSLFQIGTTKLRLRIPKSPLFPQSTSINSFFSARLHFVITHHANRVHESTLGTSFQKSCDCAHTEVAITTFAASQSLSNENEDAPFGEAAFMRRSCPRRTQGAPQCWTIKWNYDLDLLQNSYEYLFAR